ncbi:prephenate dehydratase [Bacillus timonensis]|nr:prephenate dehydratase [Bacillus timonensis]
MKETRIGYLGPKATFTELAVKKLFPQDVTIPYKTIPECIDATHKQEVTFCVVPIENAIEGSVNLTIDYLFHEQTLHIISEVVVPIKQHLMVHPNHKKSWNDITKVLSHSHAVAQCHKFLNENFNHAEIEYTSSTGAAAQYVSENPEMMLGAIANEAAAKEYHLTIVKPSIHDFENNNTRFVVLHPSPIQFINQTSLVHTGYKTTLLITLPTNQSGALHQVLSAFAWRKLNLSKIESRPMKTGLGNYFFIIDIEKKMDEVLIPGSIKELEAIGCNVKVLGSYPYYYSE